MVQKFNSKKEWLDARGIGASEASAIIGKSKWITSLDIYKKLVFKEEPKIKENERMAIGTKAEDHIRELFALDHLNEFKVIAPPKRKYWLYRRDDKPYLTCTPDGIIKKGKEKFGLEIKDVELYKKDDMEKWEDGIIPDQYFCQVLHYLIVIKDLKGVCLNAHLIYKKKNETTNKYETNYTVDRKYWVYRDDVEKQIEYLEQKETEFIKENVEKRIIPKTKI